MISVYSKQYRDKCELGYEFIQISKEQSKQLCRHTDLYESRDGSFNDW